MEKITRSFYWQCILDADDSLDSAIIRLDSFDDVEYLISHVESDHGFPHVHAILRFSDPVKLDDVMSRLHICGFSSLGVRQTYREFLPDLVKYIPPIQYVGIISLDSFFFDIAFRGHE